MDFSTYYKNKEVVDTYDLRRLKGFKSQVYRRLERKYVELLLHDCGPSLLEAGVGTGFITELLRTFGKVRGFDISRTMLEKVRSKFPEVDLEEGDILTFSSKKKYDVVISIRVLSHFNFKDVEKALVNLRALLKSKGQLIFNLENPFIIRLLLRKIINWGSTVTYQYSTKELDVLLKRAGLKQVEKKYLDHFFIIPLHLLNSLFFHRLDNFLFNLELRLSHISFMSNNTFIKCKK